MTYYLPGAYNVIDDRSGYKLKSTQVRKEWTGATVRSGSWEARHPLDLIRSIPDNQSVPDPNPDSEALFVGVNEVTADNLNANPTADPFSGVNTIWDNGGTVWDFGATIWD
jgi:hypothetical protein